ncbi:MAG: hypothetical protein DMG32_16460 [Acidobacteria bacterium]|nr:MAG: hypothetical protein DMG32_16460 [Acidobacteriota bacterium]
MKLPEHAPSMSDRASTREELFEILEVLSALEEPQGIERSPTCDLLANLAADPTVAAGETPDEASASEERFLMEVEAFNSLFGRRAERIN